MIQSEDKQEQRDIDNAITEYLLIRAARFLNVPPWELAEKPYYWMELALSCQAAEERIEFERKKANPFS